MAFLDDIKKFGKNISDKGKDAIETAKLNSQINAETDKIKEMFTKIGEQVFAAYTAGNEKGYGESCAQIAESEAKIKELKNKVLEIKDEASCPKCGLEVGKDVAFCPKCGEKLQATKTAAADPAPKPTPSKPKSKN